MKDFRRIGINMISGGAGYLVPMAINLITTPYVIKTLGQEAYGLQVLANVIIGYLIVADMGLDIPVTKKVAEFFSTNKTNDQSAFLLATVKLYILIGLLGMLCIWVFSNKLIDFLSIPVHLFDEAKTIIQLAAFGFFGSILNMWGKAVFNGMHRYDIANGVGILNNFVGIVLGLLLIKLNYGVVGFFFGRIVGFGLSNIVYWILASKYIFELKIWPLIDLNVWSILRKQIGYGFMLRLSSMIFSKTDQTLISSWMGVASVAVYSIPFLVASTLSALVSSITHFAFPLASSMQSTHTLPDIESAFTKISKFISSISTLLFVPLIIHSNVFLKLWISEEVAMQGSEVFRLLLIAFYLNTILTTAIVAFMVGVGQLKDFTIYGVGRGLSLFLFFYIFLRTEGIEGAGYSYLLTLLLDILFCYIALKYKLKYNIAALLKESYYKPVGLGAVLALIMMPIEPYINLWSQLVFVCGAYGLVYIIVAYRIGIIGPSERALVTLLIQRLKN